MTSFGDILITTLHFVLECQPITLFLTFLECYSVTLFLRRRPSKMFLTFALLLTAEASLGDACGAGCGAAAAFREEHTIFALSFNFSLLLKFFHCVK